MGFVGVSTGSSSIMTVFPRWAEILDLPTRNLVGHDVPMDAPPAVYRALVEQIRDDPNHLGALVTTHKMAVYEAAHDLFAECDRFATLCGEISSISKRDGTLIGHAKDPITVGLALNEFLSPTHFRDSSGEAIILGAGGAGTALSWNLVERSDSPSLITVVDTSDARLKHLQEVHERRGTAEGAIRYLNPATTSTSEVLASAPAGSLVVNATGLGKDRPGSPMPDDAVLPAQGVIWEFNYRGSLDFLHQATAQQEARGLTVIDGWRYFIHGWTQVIGEVFSVDMTPSLVNELATAAEFARAR